MVMTASAAGPLAVPWSRFLRIVCRQLFAFYAQRRGLSMCYLHDPLAMGVALDPTLVETRRVPLTVGPAGETVAGDSPVDVATTVDAARFLEIFRIRAVNSNAVPVPTV
jgi:inosine-uridine nucleoside N-ribohydrolase